jgi:hypothetical protein
MPVKAMLGNKIAAEFNLEFGRSEIRRTVDYRLRPDRT